MIPPTIPASAGGRAERIRMLPGYVWVAIAAALYLFIFVRVQWRVGDEGDMLNGALAVAEGRVPYRDFFDLRGPGAFYWLGMFFKAFGATWFVARAHVLLTGVLTSLLVYHLTRRASRGPGALLPCALVTALSIPLWPASHHHWDSNLFALAAVAAFVRAHDGGSTRGPMRWLLASGALAGLASCFIYQKGFLLLVAFLVLTLAWRFAYRTTTGWLRPALALLCGYGAVGVIVLAWFFSIGALKDFIDGTIRFPLETYADANRLDYAHHLMAFALGALPPLRTIPSPWAAPVALVHMWPLLFVAALPVLVALLAIVSLATRRKPALVQPDVITYGLTGFALWFSESHRLDMMHLIYGSPILLIALWLLFDRECRGRVTRRLVPLAVAVPLFVFATTQALKAARADHHIETRRGTIVMPQDDAALRFLLSDEVPRGDYVFVYPYYPTYYFLADVRNPTRYGEMMYGPGAKPHFDAAIAAIEAKQVKYVLWDTVVSGESLKEWFPAYQQPPAHEQWMERYFETRYEQVATLNGFRLLRRR